MKLSELHTGESGIIVKVTGHGGFRKRIVEMGFIKGQKVEVLLNAPLKDPVKYRVMGYEVSLRHSEANMIEVMTQEEYTRRMKAKSEAVTKDKTTQAFEEESEQINNSNSTDEQALPHKHVSDDELKAAAERESHVINVALVGNPNCGKTSLFNFASGAHERVGNYSGVTVDAKEGHAEFEGYEFNLVDLPGTYSMSAYSPEELYVRKQLVEKTPDVVINVIDTSNLERNLYLTTQVMDMHLRIVVALNMFDETEKRGDNLDLDRLSELFGMPMVPTVFKSGKGVKDLFHKVIEVYESSEDQDSHYRHIHINHGHEIEHGIKDIQEHLKKEPHIRERYSTRFLAIKLLERDKEVEDLVRKMPDAEEIFHHRDEAAKRVKEETNVDSETAIMDAKYGFIHGALKEANYHVGDNNDTYKSTHVLDRILTNRFIGFPLFLAALAIMFLTTFWLGAYPQDWLDQFFGWIGELIRKALPEGPVQAMLVDGIIGGVGSVASFLPQILILYLFISFMEDSGYMARAAFIMDKIMHKMGLHGKSFIPLIMGFGCNVPAVMATRTIESRRSRLITMLILPMMSCSARLPIYIIIIGCFFAPQWQSVVLISLYLLGILMAVLMSNLFSRWLIKGDDTPFVMELPPYRFPTCKAILRHTWEKGKQYLRKMGGIILVASIIVWALGYFPHHEGLAVAEQQELSYLGMIGKLIEPLFSLQGFNWKLDVALLSGLGAKEIVASSIGVLYNDNLQLMTADGITPLVAFSFLTFVLIYFPCVATIAAIKEESGSWRWACFTAVYTTLLAWMVSAVVYQIGSLLFAS